MQDICAENSTGTICGTIHVPEIDHLEHTCDSSLFAVMNAEPSLMNTVLDWGAVCIRTITPPPPNPKPFIYSYSLWSLCGVEPITEHCTLTFDLPADNHTCNQQEMQEIQNQVFSRNLCNRKFGEATNNAFKAEGCDPPFDFDDTSRCLVDEQGNYCSLRDDLDDLANHASDNCRNTDNCDPTCIETLNDIISIAGCCFISEFNNTEDMNYPRREWWLSDGFFQRCGVSSPGLCKQKFFSAAGIPKALGIAIAFAIALVSVIELY